MSAKGSNDTFVVRRRDLGTLALGAAALLAVTPAVAQNLLDKVWDDIRGDLQNLREDAREEVAYILGLLGYAMAIRW